MQSENGPCICVVGNWRAYGFTDAVKLSVQLSHQCNEGAMPHVQWVYSWHGHCYCVCGVVCFRGGVDVGVGVGVGLMFNPAVVQ